MSTPRAVVRIELRPLAKRKLEMLCEKRGMTQIAMMSRLFSWLMAQDPSTQNLVLSQKSRQLDQARLRKIVLWLLKHQPARLK